MARSGRRWLGLLAAGAIVVGCMVDDATPDLEADPGDDGGGGAPGAGGAGGSGAVDDGPVTWPPRQRDHAGPADQPSRLEPDPSRAFELPPLQTTLETYELFIDEAHFAEWDLDPLKASEKPAEFAFEGQRWQVEARIRGNSSRLWPRRSWRVEFPEGVTFQGRRKLNLLSQWMDCTMMVEKLGYDLLAAMHVSTLQAKFVKLYINGRYQGLYLDLEAPDKSYTRRVGFVDDDPSIYRCGGKNCEFKTWLADYQHDWEKKTNEDEGDAELRAFERLVSHVPEPDLPAMLDRSFELESFLRTMTMDALISNYVLEDSASYLMFDGFTGKWSYVVWDVNNSSTRYTPGATTGEDVAPADHPLFIFSLHDTWVELRYRERVEDQLMGRDWRPIFSNLITRIGQHPELRGRALLLLERSLDELFTVELMYARIDAMYALLEPHTVEPVDVVMTPDPERFRDTRGFMPEKFADGPRWMKDYVTRRRAFLLGELGRLSSPSPGLVLESVDAQQGTVAIGNRGATAMSLGGRLLTTNLRETSTTNLPDRTLGPGETVELRAADLGLELATDGELGLFDGVSVIGAHDVFFYGEVPAGSRYVRAADGRWEVRAR